MPAAPATVDYQHLFRLLPHNYLLLAPDGTIIDNTDRHAAVSMLPRTRAVARNIFEAYPSASESERALHASHEYVRQHRQPHAMPITRYDLQAEEGGEYQERYWQTTHYPVLDEQGELLYILLQTEDVTEQHLAELQRQAAEQALTEAEERARFILESLPIMAWTADAQGTATYLSRRWLEYTGHTEGKDLGENWLDVVHPDDRARVARTWEHAVATRTVHEQEYRLRRHDGQFRWHLIRTVPQLAADDTIGLWVGCGTDVHDQRRMVQELTEANELQAALIDQTYEAATSAQSQRETFFNLFLNAPAMISIVRGEDYVFEFVNPPYQQLRPQEQMLGRPVAEVFPEAVEQGFIALLDDVYRTGKPFIGRELPLQYDRTGTGTSEETYFDFVYQATYTGDQVTGITCFAIDVTERVRMRQQLSDLLSGNAQAHA